MLNRSNEWIDRAACAKHRADPCPPSCHHSKVAAYAAEYCRGCPVVRECAADALERGDISVVRAGVYLGTRGRRQAPGARRALASIANS
ncbi:Hypothetical protein BJL86_0449 [Dietzia timorensis]|uniref:4Fe-4S Wbl-type domain-containing protein n=2 Tax=Dietzia timorensis TaxID=499555 RepID=A0A173LG29_9ACTN|nr:Hypothetical protein BJL86_0449 [Dietzia timorensis]